MRKKVIAIWLFTKLTFIALIHLIDAASALPFNNSIQLLQPCSCCVENVKFQQKMMAVKDYKKFPKVSITTLTVLSKVH